MKEITVNNITYLFVEAPEDAIKYKISGTNYLCFKIKNRWIPEVPRLQDKFQIISTTKDITEEQAESIVEWFYDFDGIKGWYDYPDKKLVWNTAKESLQSLIQANELDITKNYIILRKL